jgi:hypothetical protein
LQPGGDPLKGLSCRNLRAAAAFGKQSASRACRRSDLDALDLEHLEPRAVDRLERKRTLEPLLRGRIELACRAKRPLAIELGPITLKAQRTPATPRQRLVTESPRPRGRQRSPKCLTA